MIYLTAMGSIGMNMVIHTTLQIEFKLKWCEFCMYYLSSELPEDAVVKVFASVMKNVV